MKKLLTTYREAIIPIAEGIISGGLPANPTINITEGEFITGGTPEVNSSITQNDNYFVFPDGDSYTSHEPSGLLYQNKIIYKQRSINPSKIAFSMNIRVNTPGIGGYYGLLSLDNSELARIFLSTHRTKGYSIIMGGLDTYKLILARPYLEYDKWYTFSGYITENNKIITIISDGVNDTNYDNDNIIDNLELDTPIVLGSSKIKGQYNDYYVDTKSMYLKDFIFYDRYLSEDEFNNLHLWNKLRLK